jgi:hypothetical protein
MRYSVAQCYDARMVIESNVLSISLGARVGLRRLSYADATFLVARNPGADRRLAGAR